MVPLKYLNFFWKTLMIYDLKNDTHRRSYEWYFLRTVEVKDYNVMIDGKNIYDQPIKNDLRTYENIWKIATGQGDDYTTSCLLDCNSFKNYHKIIAVHLSKHQALDPDTEAIQQINFTTNLDRAGKTAMDIILKEAK